MFMSRQPRFKIFSRSTLSACVVDTLNRIVFDAGGALPFIVPPRYENIFVTHCDPDHVLGLFTYALLRGKEKVNVFAPTSCAHMLMRWSQEFYIENLQIKGVKDGEEISISENSKVVVISVKHLQKDAVAFLLKHKQRKLCPEYTGLPPHEVSELVKKGVKVTSEEWTNDTIYTGDLDRESLENLPMAKFLITETTYPNAERQLADQYGHVCEEDVNRVATKYEHVIKVHESLGYYDRPHTDENVERVNLGKYEG